MTTSAGRPRPAEVRACGNSGPPAAAEDIGLGRRLGRRLLPSTLLVAVLISVGMPATYYHLESRVLRHNARTYALDAAQHLHELAVESPADWTSRPEVAARLREVFAAHQEIATVRVLDEQGRPIAALTQERRALTDDWTLTGPFGEVPVVVHGRTVATVTVHVAEEALLGVTLALLVVSVAVGLALGIVVYAVPVRLARGMEPRIADLVGRVQRSNAELERRASELSTLLELTRATGSVLDDADLFRVLADGATRACAVDGCAIFLWDESGDYVMPVAARLRGPADGHTVETATPGSRLAVASIPFLDEAVRSREPVVLGDPARDPRMPVGWPERERLTALLAVPLLHRNRTIGALVLDRRGGPAPFTPDQVELAITLAGQAALAIQNTGLVRNLRQALDDLSQAQQRLVQGETLRAVGELAAGMSHHLNNLLAVVLGRVELLLAQVANTDIRPPLEVVERAAADAAEVVRRVQEFTRTGGLSRGVPLDLNEICRDVLEMSRARWENDAVLRGIVIDARLEPGDVPPLVGEPAAMREVLMSLVLNAIDAMPDGGTLALRTWARGTDVFGSVADTGLGMTDEVRERAFQPFFTTKGVKSTGLGLSTSYAIVRRHGGDLAIDSSEGRGTTVTIRLPIGRPQAARGPAAVVPGLSASLTILAVDDSPQALDLLNDMLNALGHRVVKATGGHEVLALLDSGIQPDLVITDLGMPGMNGWQVAAAVKSRAASLPVVLITGWGEDPPRLADNRERVDVVVAKPFDHKTLQAAVSRAVRRGRTAASSVS